MAYQLDIPNLSGSDIAVIYQFLDAQLNSGVLYVFLHGIYTGIVAVTLWNFFTHKSRPIGRQFMVAAMLLLFIVTTISVGFHWSYIISAFIDNSQSFWSRFSVLEDPQNGILLGMGITGAISTIVADSTMIWRCWIVWGRRWPVVLPPILMLFSGIVFKLMNTYQGYTNGSDYVLGFALYLSFILATTIWCTSLIIYRILTVGQASNGIGVGVGVYRHVIEVFVESSVLYSFVLILDMAFEVREEWENSYVDVMAAIVRGIAPTLLVGRVAAGHARSDQSWQGSVISSLHFGTRRFRARDQSSTEVETLQSVGIDKDWEVERGEMDRHKRTRTESQEYYSPSDVTLQDDLEAQDDHNGEAVGRAD
ncbi:hypothetical protein ARMSODRAFT_1086114 [Armillaria solidipes]|uniref:Family A G protein-coupled receptor-like protein n=1 Tax=Armillaria solidipes TaxID=1076256 RepID=A0A2H3BSP9_9AGAR|nr:hypothetical protein ARMSODRAFT_1086114 [Armillaria solidipes]